MVLGPVEIVVIAFPGNKFSGLIIPELAALVESDTISIIDGLLVYKDESGAVSFIEIDEAGDDDDAARLAAILDEVKGIISDEDVEALTADIPPGNSAAVLAFEHTWIKPFRDSIIASGGVLLESTRVPGVVVEEVLAAIAELEEA
jgi:hypothetical protein